MRVVHVELAWFSALAEGEQCPAPLANTLALAIPALAPRSASTSPKINQEPRRALQKPREPQGTSSQEPGEMGAARRSERESYRRLGTKEPLVR
jgi:hypothetical protein